MSLRRRIQPLRTRILLLLAVIGPGIITANVDNDAGGITTYSVAGAHYGYQLLWLMPLVVLALIVIQEMSARLGVVTGKGLAGLIRESLGVKISAVVLGILVIANLGNTISEFAGVAASLEIFGISKYISVPLAALGVWVLIVKGSYKSVERIFLVASSVYLAYVISGLMAQPDWVAVRQGITNPSFQFDSGYLVIAVTIIGTTIAPWMQFYQQSSIADKGLRVEDYAYERVDVVVGSIFAVFVAAFITIACAATLFEHGMTIDTAKDAALALGPLAGHHAETLFALGLLNASVFSAAILPLSTAYVVCEAFGWEAGVSRELKEAPVFFTIYTVMIVIGALVIMMPIKSLVQTMMISQTLNGILLPFILVVMLQLINDPQLMGKHVNNRFINILSWVTVVALIGLTVILVLSTIFPHLF